MFLGGQRGDPAIARSAQGQPRGTQLVSGPVGPRAGAQGTEGGKRGTEVNARVAGVLDPAQVLAESQMDPGELKRPPVGAAEAKGLPEELAGLAGRGRERG